SSEFAHRGTDGFATLGGGLRGDRFGTNGPVGRLRQKPDEDCACAEGETVVVDDGIGEHGEVVGQTRTAPDPTRTPSMSMLRHCSTPWLVGQSPVARP